MTAASQFIYLLNAMEAAAADPFSSNCGYGAKRKAVLDYVAKLEAAGGEAAQPLDRGDAVNLASNIDSRLDTGSYNTITDKGVKILADAVLRMDKELRRLYGDSSSAAPNLRYIDDEFLAKIQDSRYSSEWVGIAMRWRLNPSPAEQSPTYPMKSGAEGSDPHSAGSSSAAPSVARESILDEVLAKLDSNIKRGPLPGNGCDQTAQNGGIVIAYNLVFYMRHPALPKPKYAEDIK